MDASTVETVSAILSDDTHRSELEELCVAALYGKSRGALDSGASLEQSARTDPSVSSPSELPSAFTRRWHGRRYA
ncbi:hypothetical protein GUJ93_ZPchr0008g13399 [Zizania palustris]|uniref:Uncharacterized protein n=1 Tax=Zizania palustris TaxID=103762 RepID=A0A8J5VJK4_ZIZPA|nr:hypothetical protein GUJ93_ZPchr0008g13399 [Zizania palustris]